MPRPLSYDLRRKAVEAVKRGEKKIRVCRLLKISRNTLDLWLKRELETGDVRPLPSTLKGTKPKIQDERKFLEFVLVHHNKTQTEIAKLWGENLTQQNVSRMCRKLGITRKKNIRVSGEG